jgi:FkbM family methyltransferase
MPVDFGRLEELQEVYYGGKLRKLLHSPVRIVWTEILKELRPYLSKPIETRVRTFWGREMTVFLPEDVSVAIYRYGLFEMNLTQAFLRLLYPGATFFDIGAHFGFFTLLASDIIGPQGSVHSFEPTPSTYAVLQNNVALADNTTINNFAVWSEDKEIEFNDYGIMFSAYNSFTSPKLSKKERRAVRLHSCKIPAICIDSYVERTGVVPNFVKIDAETAEYNIIQGMERTIRTYYPTISVEVGDVPDAAPSSRRTLDLALSMGYVALECGTDGFRPHVLKDRYDYDNMVLVGPDVMDKLFGQP